MNDEEKERAAWGEGLRVGSVVAMRSAALSPFVAPYRIHTVTKANRKTVALFGLPDLVLRQCLQLVPATGDIRRAIAAYHLKSWSLHCASDQISKLTLGQQAALMNLVSRMAADPTVLS